MVQPTFYKGLQDGQHCQQALLGRGLFGNEAADSFAKERCREMLD